MPGKTGSSASNGLAGGRGEYTNRGAKFSDGLTAAGAFAPEVDAAIDEIYQLPAEDVKLLKNAGTTFGVGSDRYDAKRNRVYLSRQTLYDITNKGTDDAAFAAKTIRHEVGHAVDYLRGQQAIGSEGFKMNPNVQAKKVGGRTPLSLSSNNFRAALTNDLQTARKTPEGRQFLKKNDYYTTPTGVTGYWTEQGSRRSLRLEMFAETYARITGANSTEKAEWSKHFPSTIKAANAILKDLR